MRILYDYHVCICLYINSLWLLIWTANNVGVTLLNKAAFSTVDFHYPFFLSAIHMAICMLGARFTFYLLDHAKLRRSKHLHAHQSYHENNNDSNDNNNNNHNIIPIQSPATIEQILGTGITRLPLDPTGQRLILIFSIIFSLNIAIGNVSLKHVSVNFNQVMRSLVPAITIAMGICLGKPASRRRIIAVVPIIVGVAMACFGDMSYTTRGFVTTVFCILLAAFKVVASGELLTGKVQLHPVDLLAHMAPLSLIQCMAMALINGEIHNMFERWSNVPWWTPDAIYPTFVVFMSGILSFTLNISSLQANKLTSPLTLCIAANVKQVVMIAVSTIVFGTEISPLNGSGIIVVLLGSARYSYISVVEKNQQQSQQQPSSQMTKLLSEPTTSNDNETNNNNNSSFVKQPLQHRRSINPTAATSNTLTGLGKEDSSNNGEEMVSLLSPRHGDKV